MRHTHSPSVSLTTCPEASTRTLPDVCGVCRCMRLQSMQPEGEGRHASVRTRTHPCRTAQARAHDTQPRMHHTHTIPTFDGCTGSTREFCTSGVREGGSNNASNENTLAGCAVLCRVGGPARVTAALRGARHAIPDAKTGASAWPTAEAARSARQHPPGLHQHARSVLSLRPLQPQVAEARAR